jgi:hypothetical protein
MLIKNNLYSMRLDQTEGNWELNELKFGDFLLLAAAMKATYRVILAGKENFVPLLWKDVVKETDKLILKADIAPFEGYSKEIELWITPSHAKAAGHEFRGVAFSFHSNEIHDWAGEIQLEFPLNVNNWTSFVQDLYTQNKSGFIDADWRGIDFNNYQGARSPLEFITNDDKALWGRLEKPDQMFSSRAALQDDKATFFLQFSFDSQSAWTSCEFAWLIALDVNAAGTSKYDLWAQVFESECQRWRSLFGIVEDTVIPMANLPIDGGTPGCAPENDRNIYGTFDEFADYAIDLCCEMNYKRILIGSPWVSSRTEGRIEKCTRAVTYDSRCGTVEFEISPSYGGRKSFKRFCDAAHKHDIEVFVWYPAFHLSNHAPFLHEHPEAILRSANGAPFTYVFFHLSILSLTPEVQKYCVDKMEELKKDCGFDGLWLDSYNNFSFMSMDFSQKHGVSMCREGIEIIRKFQETGLKIINEGYSPFGARGDGEAMFYKDQECMALDTSLFTYYKNSEELIDCGSFFRFMANKAPLTIAVKYVPKHLRREVGELNKIYNDIYPLMQKRKLLQDKLGVQWNNKENITIIFAYKNGVVDLKTTAIEVCELRSGQKLSIVAKQLQLEAGKIYYIKTTEA